MVNINKHKKFFLLFNLFYVFFLFCVLFNIFQNGNIVYSQSAKMPFYDLCPQDIVLRAEFYTSYPSSSNERKFNIKLAAKHLNNCFVDVGGEFSFNNVVGPRTESRGFKQAKIIVGGRFVDGVGGGVCQVSGTLYNAVLLSGLKIIEYHPHSLPVSYLAPSFDAMVSSVSDLKFINNTKNPIIIKTFANDSTVKISIFGEPMKEKYIRKSQILETIYPPENLIIYDVKKEYPNLLLGEQQIIQYAKNGYKSQGFLIKTLNGKVVSTKKIRTDKYNAVQGIIVEGVVDISENNSAEEKLAE